MPQTQRPPRYEPPRTRAERRRGESGPAPAPGGVVLAALLPLILVAGFEALLWMSDTDRLAVRPDVLRVLPYVAIIPVATFVIDRGVPRWGIPWAALALWGAFVVLREVARRLGVWMEVNNTTLTVATASLLAVTAAAALLVVARLRRTGAVVAVLFLACFLLADLMGVGFRFADVAASGRAGQWVGAALAVQVVVAALALRWALGGNWLGVWLLVGLVVASPALTYGALVLGRTGTAELALREAVVAWWPIQAALLAVGAWISFWSPWARGAGEVDTRA